MRDYRKSSVIAVSLNVLTQTRLISCGYLLVSACNAFLMDEGAADICYHNDKRVILNYCTVILYNDDPILTFITPEIVICIIIYLLLDYFMQCKEKRFEFPNNVTSPQAGGWQTGALRKGGP